ncbi:MAG: tetratricopeptide repeat protein [Candidatus Mariimomonas ferrooxydans]
MTIHKGKNDKEAAINELRELVSIYENKDLPQETIQACRELLELNPADKKVQVKIEKLEKKLGIKEPAAVAVPIENRSVEEVLPGVDEYIRSGLLKEAIGLLQQLKAKDSGNIDVRTRLKNVYLESGEKDNVIGECLAIAEIYEKKGDLDAKNSLIKEAKVLNPDDPRLVTVSMPSPGLGKAAVAPGKDAVPPAGEPRESFEEKLAEADFYTQQGLVDEAVNIYKELLSVFPDNEEIKKKLGSLSSAEVPEEQPVEKAAADSTVDSDLKDIFKEFKKGIEDELGEQDSETRYNLGIAYKEMGLLEDAIREFKIAAKDPEKTVQSSSMLALCYMDKKQYPLAIQEFKKTVEAMDKTDKEYLGAKCDLADAYVKNNDHAKALVIYKEVLAQDPKFRDVARKVKIIKNLASEDKDKPKSKKDRVSYI